MPDTSGPTRPHTQCTVCSTLLDEEYAFQKNGWPQDDSHLPSAAAHLIVVKDYKLNSDRKLQLQQCPECGTYYVYQTDYEFLAGGSEDEQTLTRLTPDQALEYLSRPAPGDRPPP